MATELALLLLVIADAAYLGVRARPSSLPLVRPFQAAARGAVHGLGLAALLLVLAAGARRLSNLFLFDPALEAATRRALPVALVWGTALLLSRGRTRAVLASGRPLLVVGMALAALLAAPQPAMAVLALLFCAGLLLLPRLLALPAGALWPQVRAAWLSAHLFAITLFAIPAPVGGMNRADWKDPTVQTEFGAWAGRLHLEPARLEDLLWAAAVEEMSLRDRVTSPFLPYISATGTDQPWRMFVAPHHFPTRLSVEVRREEEPPGSFHPVFVERSSTFTWRRELFDQERLRSGIFRHTFAQFAYDARLLCEWASRRLFAEEPSVVEVRCRLRRARLPSPEEASAGIDPPGTWEETGDQLRPGLTPTPTPLPASAAPARSARFPQINPFFRPLHP